MDFYRTLFHRHMRPPRPTFSVTQVTPPATTTVTVSAPQIPAPPSLKFNVASNSQYLPIVAF